jgi:hypothetical protein
MSRRSRRFQKKQEKYNPKPLLETYVNQIGVRTKFNNYKEFASDVPKDMVRLHNQGVNPFCALYSVVTAVEIAQKRPWNKEERAARKAFCLREGKKRGDHLENTLKYYDQTFPFDMKYEKACDTNKKDYANANDLIRGLQQSVCVVSLSCADVDSKYGIRNKKNCMWQDWHCITCVAFVLIKNIPTFVFKDTNNRPNNKENFVYLEAKDFTDAQLLITKEMGDNPWGGVEASEKVRKLMSKENLLYVTEIYIIRPAMVGKIKKIIEEDTDYQAVEDIKELLKTPVVPKPKPAKPKHPRKPRRKPAMIRLKNIVDMWHDGDMIWKKAKVVGKRVDDEHIMYSLKIDSKEYEASMDEVRIPSETSRLNAYIYSIYDAMQEFSKLIRDTMAQREQQIKAVMKSRWFSNVDSMIDAMVCVESNGSGCIIETDQGPMVLTCAHCNMTERETQMENEEFDKMVRDHGSYKEYNKFAVGRLKGIAWSDGSWGVAETVYNSEGMDIALMKIITTTKSFDTMSRLQLAKLPPELKDKLVMIHNPYRYDPDDNYSEIDRNFPFRVELDEIVSMGENKCVENTFGAYVHDNDKNSFFGSSGSPIINSKGFLVAIHNSTDPNDDWKRYAVGLESIQQALREYVDGAPTRECEEVSYKLKF